LPGAFFARSKNYTRRSIRIVRSSCHARAPCRFQYSMKSSTTPKSRSRTRHSRSTSSVVTEAEKFRAMQFPILSSKLIIRIVAECVVRYHTNVWIVLQPPIHPDSIASAPQPAMACLWCARCGCRELQTRNTPSRSTLPQRGSTPQRDRAELSRQQTPKARSDCRGQSVYFQKLDCN
jgi:hypothetical protein